MSFKEKKYEVIPNAISYELANFAFNYFLLKRDAVTWMYQNNYISEFTPGFGTWKDKQIPNTYSCYGDFFHGNFNDESITCYATVYRFKCYTNVYLY